MFTSGLLRSFRASMSHADHSPCPPTSVLTARTNLWMAPFSCVRMLSTPIQFDISVCHHIIQFSRMGRNGSFQNSTWQFDNSAYIWNGIGSNLEVDNLKDKFKHKNLFECWLAASGYTSGGKMKCSLIDNSMHNQIKGCPPTSFVFLWMI